MAAVWTRLGLIDKVRALLALDPLPQYVMHLYTNDLAPDWPTVLTDFVECAAPGYLPLPFAVGDWRLTDVPTVVTARQNPRLFRFGAPGLAVQLFGYFVLNVTTGRVAWAERFAAPFTIPPLGGTLSIQVAFVDSAE